MMSFVFAGILSAYGTLSAMYHLKFMLPCLCYWAGVSAASGCPIVAYCTFAFLCHAYAFGGSQLGKN